MNDKIKSLIAENEIDGDFTRVAPTPEMIESAQQGDGGAGVHHRARAGQPRVLREAPVRGRGGFRCR